MWSYELWREGTSQQPDDLPFSHKDLAREIGASLHSIALLETNRPPASSPRWPSFKDLWGISTSGDSISTYIKSFRLFLQSFLPEEEGDELVLELQKCLSFRPKVVRAKRSSKGKEPFHSIQLGDSLKRDSSCPSVLSNIPDPCSATEDTHSSAKGPSFSFQSYDGRQVVEALSSHLEHNSEPMDGKAEIDISELQLKPSDSCSFSAFRHYTRYRQYNNSIPRIVDLAALANENSDLVKFKLEDFRLFLEQSLQPKTAGIYLSKFWSLIGKIAAKSSSTNEGNNESGHHYEEPRLCSGIEVGDDLDASVNPPASLDARSKSQTASPHQETVAASQQLNIISLLSDSQSDVSNAETAGGKAAGNVNDFPFIIKANKDIESKIDPLFSSAANHFEAYRANLVTVPSIKELAALLRVGSSAAVESHIAGFKKHLAENLVRSRKSRKFAKISDRTIDNFCNDLRRLFKSINRPHGVDRIMDKGSVSEDYGVNESDNIEKTGGGIGVVTNDDFKAFVDKKNPAVRSAYHRFQEYRSSNPSVPSIFELIALHNSNSGAFILHLNSFERHLRENGVVLKNSPHRNIGDKLQEKSVKDIVGRLTFIITSLSQRTNNESSKSDDSDSVENERVEEQLANTNHHSKVSRRNYRWGLANKPTKAALNRFEEYRLSRQTVPSIDELISVYKSEPEMVDRQLDQFRLSLEETGVHLKKGPSWKSGDKLSSTTIISYISNLSRYISLKSQRNGYSVGQDEYSLDDREKEQENSLPDLPSIGILAEDSEILEVHIDLFQKYLKKQSLSKVLVNRHPEEIRKLLTRNAVGGTKSTKSDFAEAIGVRRDSELLKDSEEVNVVDDEDGDGDDNGGPNEMGRETESNKETDLPFSLAEMFNRGGSSSKEKRRMQVALEHYVLFRGRQKNKAPPSMGKLWTEWDSRTNNMFVKKNLANFLQVYFLDNCAQFECVLPRKSVIENLEAIIQCLSYKSFNLETIDPQELFSIAEVQRFWLEISPSFIIHVDAISATFQAIIQRKIERIGATYSETVCGNLTHLVTADILPPHLVAERDLPFNMRSPYHFSAFARETIEKILQARDLDISLWPLGKLLSILDLIDLSWESAEGETFMSVSAELGEAIFSATRSEEAFSRPRVFLSNSDDDQDGSEDGYCSDSEADLLDESFTEPFSIPEVLSNTHLSKQEVAALFHYLKYRRDNPREPTFERLWDHANRNDTRGSSPLIKATVLRFAQDYFMPVTFERRANNIAFHTILNHLGYLCLCIFKPGKRSLDRQELFEEVKAMFQAKNPMYMKLQEYERIIHNLQMDHSLRRTLAMFEKFLAKSKNPSIPMLTEFFQYAESTKNERRTRRLFEEYADFLFEYKGSSQGRLILQTALTLLDRLRECFKKLGPATAVRLEFDWFADLKIRLRRRYTHSAGPLSGDNNNNFDFWADFEFDDDNGDEDEDEGEVEAGPGVVSCRPKSTRVVTRVVKSRDSPTSPKKIKDNHKWTIEDDFRLLKLIHEIKPYNLVGRRPKDRAWERIASDMDIYFQSTGREDVQLKLENLRTRFHRLFTFGLTGNAQANSIALGSIDDNHQRSLVISAINREMSKKHQRGDAVGRDEIGGYSDAAAEDEDSDYEMFDKFKSLVDRLKANELRPTYRSKRSKRKKPLLPSWPLTVYTGGGDGGDRAGLGCNEASSDPRTAVSADGSEEGMPDPEQLQQQQQQQQLLFLPDLPTGDHRPQQQQQYKQKNLHQQQLIQRFMMQLDEDKENSSSTATATATTTTQVDEVQREAGKIGSAMSSVNKGPTGLHCLKRSFVTTLENQEEQIEFEQGMDFCHVLSKIRRVLDEHRDKMECEDEEEGNLETPTSSVEMTSTISTTTATSISSSIRSILMSAAVTDGTACGEGETLDLSFQLVEMKANLGNKLLSRGHDAVSVSNLLQQI